MIGQAVGWLLLLLAALLLAALVLPVTAHIQAGRGGLRAKVRLLCFFFPLWPAPPRAEREQRPGRKKRRAGHREEGGASKRGRAQRIELAKRLLAAAGSAAGVVLRRLRVHAVQLEVPVYAACAAETALRCAQVQAAVGAANAALGNLLALRWKRVWIYPDFAGQMRENLFFACKISLRPIILVMAGAVFIKEYLSARRYGKKALKQALIEKQKAQAERRAA